MAAYPSSLPAPQISGYEVAPADPVIRTEMEAGPQRRRRRYTNAPVPITLTWKFTDLEYAIFDAWHHHELNDGAIAFSIHLRNGLGCQTWNDVAFLQMPRAKILPSGIWEVTAQVESADRPMMTPETLAPYL